MTKSYRTRRGQKRKTISQSLAVYFSFIKRLLPFISAVPPPVNKHGTRARARTPACVCILNFYGAARRGFMRSCRPRRRRLVAAEGLTGRPARRYIDLRVVHIAFGPASLVGGGGGGGSIVRVFRL